MDIDLTWEPEPDMPEWAKAYAVLAKCPNCYEYLGRTVHLKAIGHDWMCGDCQAYFDFRDTKDVAPLYPLPTRDEIADELRGWTIGDGYYQMSVPLDEARDMADAVLDLMKGVKE